MYAPIWAFKIVKFVSILFLNVHTPAMQQAPMQHYCSNRVLLRFLVIQNLK